MKRIKLVPERRRGGFLADMAAAFLSPTGAAALAVSLCGLVLVARETNITERHEATISSWGHPGNDGIALRDAVAFTPRTAVKPARAPRHESARERQLRYELGEALRSALSDARAGNPAIPAP